MLLLWVVVVVCVGVLGRRKGRSMCCVRYAIHSSQPILWFIPRSRSMPQPQPPPTPNNDPRRTRVDARSYRHWWWLRGGLGRSAWPVLASHGRRSRSTVMDSRSSSGDVFCLLPLCLCALLCALSVGGACWHHFGYGAGGVEGPGPGLFWVRPSPFPPSSSERNLHSVSSRLGVL